jgi:hypothetical protein
MLRRSELKGIHVPGTDCNLLVSLFADDTTIFLSQADSWNDLWRILDLWCTASTAKFNTKKTIVLPFGSAQHRAKILKERKFGQNSVKISDELTMVPDKQSCRFLGAWIENIDYITPWPEITGGTSPDGIQKTIHSKDEDISST